MQHLIIFDIDGTLLDSVLTDQQCFEASLQHVFDIPSTQIDWNSFPNMTDSALIRDILHRLSNKQHTRDELLHFQNDFFLRLSARSDQMSPVPGARSYLDRLHKREDCFVAIATGCWRNSAAIKLQNLDISPEDFVLSTSDDHYLRTNILSAAIARSRARYKIGEHHRVTYIGDGTWDARSAKSLATRFLGVDLHGSKVLTRYGVKIVIPNFLDQEFLDETLLRDEIHEGE